MSTTALVYVRQSRSKLYDATVSPEVQEKACRALPAVAACERVEVFADLDVSGGGTKKRPALAALLARLDAGGVSVVAAYDQSRAFRNTRDALDFFARMEQLPDVEVAFVHGRFDRTTVGGFSYTVLSASHEMERRLSGDKVRGAYAYLIAQGIPTGPAPYGYRYVGGSRASGELEFDPATAPIVRRIFEDYASGTHTSKSIAAALTAEEVAPAGRSGEWLPDTVAQLLANVRYNGKTYLKSRDPNRPGRPGKAERGALVTASWPVLIDDGLFQRVQDRLKSWHVPTAKGGHRRQREFVFRGLLWCRDCNRRFAAMSNHGVYYYCGSRETNKPCEHGRHAIREDKLTPWVDDLMDAFAAFGMKGREFAQRAARDTETAAKAVEKVDRMITRLGIRFQAEELTEAQYRSELERLRRQRSIYAAQAEGEPARAEFVDISSQWRSGGPGERWAVLTALFERLTVVDGEIVNYEPRADRANRVRIMVETALDELRSNQGDKRSERDLNPRWLAPQLFSRQPP
jgi:DNA invertase Pin-like site-specific DNA recombinase